MPKKENIDLDSSKDYLCRMYNFPRNKFKIAQFIFEHVISVFKNEKRYLSIFFSQKLLPSHLAAIWSFGIKAYQLGHDLQSRATCGVLNLL